ncbi:uncharacterized protein TrAFT101_011957 [Trichoderma asperellum]|uniref:uncharacterized protein n=1 Tax=Trichoderma asperellum TaxID=101201 RepID=UPI003326C298|nr:hypothetical protein TrAFT101_011957 [Trichoderma asperellum]
MCGKGMKTDATATSKSKALAPKIPTGPSGSIPVLEPVPVGDVPPRPVAPPVGGTPAPSSGYFSKLSGGVLIGGPGIEPAAPVVPSRNPSIAIPSRASSIVPDGPKVLFYLINGGQEVQVVSSPSLQLPPRLAAAKAKSPVTDHE